MDTTICAISTAVGTGAISIIRCSGKNAISIVNSIFSGKDLISVTSHTINYGYIVDNNEKIDEVLVSIMRAPKTFTKEDMVEINSHGGPSTTNKILEILLNHGCTMAEPGEFTKRAFLNGRIDLLEAEAVSDLINSETEKARKLAINQIEGHLSSKIKSIRQKLISLQADIEVDIDYPEYEDTIKLTNDTLKPQLESIHQELVTLISDSENGKLIKNGIDVALIGKPNVGKSSILNKILDENKAIVTSIAGTTRDVVEGKFVLNGILLNILDTAGIRKTNNQVEKIGVEKSLTLSRTADLVIYILDNSQKLKQEDIDFLDQIKNQKIIIFINKNDVKCQTDFSKLSNYHIVYGNTIDENGLDGLKKAITTMFDLNKIETSDYSFISNARQISLARQANESILNALSQIKMNIAIDMVTIDIKNAYDLLGEIIGQTYKDDLLDELFSKFCLGK